MFTFFYISKSGQATQNNACFLLQKCICSWTCTLYFKAILLCLVMYLSAAFSEAGHFISIVNLRDLPSGEAPTTGYFWEVQPHLFILIFIILWTSVINFSNNRPLFTAAVSLSFEAPKMPSTKVPSKVLQWPRHMLWKQ